MKSEIKDAKWFTPPLNTIVFDAMTGASQGIAIGIVCVQITPQGDWKCYIGYGRGQDEDEDAQRIAENGMPLANPAAAAGFFPDMDPERYQY